MRLFLLALAVLAAPLHADPLKDAALRQGYFKLIGAEMAALSAMAKGDAPFDANTVALSAANLRALSAYDVTPLFSAGASNAAIAGETRALPLIFEASEMFAGGFDEMARAVEPLAQAGDAEALAEALGAVGASCKSCHRMFRAGEF